MTWADVWHFIGYRSKRGRGHGPLTDCASLSAWSPTEGPIEAKFTGKLRSWSEICFKADDFEFFKWGKQA